MNVSIEKARLMIIICVIKQILLQHGEGDGKMLAPITKHYKDLSTADSFAFAFFCDHCCVEWRSDVYAFSLKGFEHSVDERIREML
jgi:hypothetical protein